LRLLSENFMKFLIKGVIIINKIYFHFF
jgi:hypothetical protein